MNNPLYKTFSTDELDANYGTVSLNKCGICLCRQGWADVLMNNHRYHIEKNGLCLYTPYTFIRILQHSDEFDGYLMEADLEVLSAETDILRETSDVILLPLLQPVGINRSANSRSHHIAHRHHQEEPGGKPRTNVGSIGLTPRKDVASHCFPVGKTVTAGSTKFDTGFPVRVDGNLF